VFETVYDAYDAALARARGERPSGGPFVAVPEKQSA
jgi:hypothetical protein